MKTQSFITILVMMIAQMSFTFAADPQQPTKEQLEMSTIATQAFQILNDVPVKGLDQSTIGIEQIIATHRRLAKSDDATQRYFSIVLADSVAYAIVNEIHRANYARLGLTQRISPNTIQFNKKTAVRLWRENIPDFDFIIRKALKGNDTLINYIAEHSSTEKVLDGRMMKELPVGSMSSYAIELHQKMEVPLPNLKVSDLTPDMLLMFALMKWQSFRDVSIVIEQYEQKDIPEDFKEFRQLFESLSGQYRLQRVDEGMKTSYFKLWSAFNQYSPENSVGSSGGPAEEYTIRQTGALLPFMTDTSSLPEPSQKMLKQLRRMEKKAEAKKKAIEAKRGIPGQ
ncbi:hypothetical protein LLG95_04545 [bacterium]|nr:hypothetical protein [bacterium]